MQEALIFSVRVTCARKYYANMSSIATVQGAF